MPIVVVVVGPSWRLHHRACSPSAHFVFSWLSWPYAGVRACTIIVNSTCRRENLNMHPGITILAWGVYILYNFIFFVDTHIYVHVSIYIDLYRL